MRVSRLWGLAVLGIVMSAGLAHAAGTVIGTVSGVNVIDANDLVLIKLVGTATGAPGCATVNTSTMAADLKKEAGRAMLAVALSAKASGITIGINGGGGCTRLSGYEDAAQVFQ